jgi:hypothetical protein
MRMSSATSANPFARRFLTVADTSNYLPVFGRQPEGHEASPVDAIEAGKPETAWLQEQWGRPVIRAWNPMFGPTFVNKGKAPGEPGRIALCQETLPRASNWSCSWSRTPVSTR